jgi:Fic family protein
MNEFEKTLKEYRKLVEQINDERGFLSFLEDQLRDVEKKLKMFGSAYFQMQTVHTVQLPLSSEPDESLPAVEEAAHAVETLGDGVTAEQLAKHLDISRDAARLRLQRGARVGLIARMGIGRYRAVKRAPKGASDSHQIHHGANGTTGEDEVRALDRGIV